MFLTHAKAQAVKGLRSTFDGSFPTPDFQSVKISSEYPVTPQDYPSIWVDFEPQGSLSIVGIGHDEFVDTGVPGQSNARYRWRFSGYFGFTAVAMTSFERDRLVDAMIGVMAFSRQPDYADFRDALEGGQFIAMNADFDQIEMRGFSASPGTPWGSDEMIYEGTIAMEVTGEFVGVNPVNLIELSGVELINWEVGWGSDPTSGVWQGEPVDPG